MYEKKDPEGYKKSIDPDKLDVVLKPWQIELRKRQAKAIGWEADSDDEGLWW